MNGAPVSVLHGAPLRLRCENEVGFKMVKWIAAIELVHDYRDLGAGQGGYNEDHEFYGHQVPIRSTFVTPLERRTYWPSVSAFPEWTTIAGSPG